MVWGWLGELWSQVRARFRRFRGWFKEAMSPEVVWCRPVPGWSGAGQVQGSSKVAEVSGWRRCKVQAMPPQQVKAKGSQQTSSVVVRGGSERRVPRRFCEGSARVAGTGRFRVRRVPGMHVLLGVSPGHIFSRCSCLGICVRVRISC